MNWVTFSPVRGVTIREPTLATGYPFGLDIPAPRDGPEPVLDLSARGVEHWLKELPLAEPVTAARRVQRVLAHSAYVRLSPPARLRFLDRLQEPVTYLLDALENMVLSYGLPLSSKAAGVADLALTLANTYAEGYRLGVADALAGGRRPDRRQLARAILGALRQMNRVLLSAYTSYTPPPRHAWAQIHRLYALARMGGVTEVPVRAAAGDSVDNAYKRILLLALADPYRLRQGEAHSLRRLLGPWAGYLSLGATPPKAPRGTLYYCQEGHDGPPRPAVPVPAPDTQGVIYLDLQPVIAVLRGRMSQQVHDAEPAPHPSQYDLMRRVVVGWEQRRGRDFSRARKSLPVCLAVGLGAAHRLMEAQQSASHPAEPAHADGPTIPELEPEPEPPAWALAPVTDSARHWWQHEPSTSPDPVHHGHPTEGGRSANAAPEPEDAPETWTALDVSAGGYCLLREAGRPLPAQIGDVVTVREGDETSGWGVGVIRWMRYVQDEGLRIGVQVLAPAALAVSSRMDTAAPIEGPTAPCLELPEIEALHQPRTLLTPAHQFRVGDSLTIDSGTERLSVKLTKQLENTGNVARFQFTPIPEPKENTGPALRH